MKKYVVAALILFFTLGVAKLAAAQDSPRQEPGKSPGQSVERERRSSDTNVDIRVQKGDEGRRGPQGPEGRPGPEGAPGPRGPAGAPGSGGTFWGMDPTVALLVGLAVLAVVIVAIVAASGRGGREVH
jgi:hypothetical protein